jgi:hypothetical protein
MSQGLVLGFQAYIAPLAADALVVVAAAIFLCVPPGVG